MRITVALLLLIAFGALTDTLADGVLRLDVDRTAKYGCKVDEQGPYWRTTVWADYKDEPSLTDDVGTGNAGHSYAKVFSMRESRRKALNDCDKWMTDTAKKIAAANQKAGRK